MPELPEVETVVRELRPKLKNKIIRDVKVLLPKMVAVGPATLSNLRKTDGTAAVKFARNLRGQKISDIRRRAKMIIVDLVRPSGVSLGGHAVLIHLKMTGQLIFLDKKHLHKQVRLLNIETRVIIYSVQKSIKREFFLKKKQKSGLV